MKMKLNARDLKNGFEISVAEFNGDPTSAEEDPNQIYLEVYQGKLILYAFNGAEDPTKIVFEPRSKIS